MNIQIKDTYGEVLFEYNKEDNTIKDTLVKAVEEGISLFSVDLEGADLRYANLYKADLCHANFRNANLDHACLNYADLRFANFYNAKLSHTGLGYADLRSAVFGGTTLDDVTLYGADLSYADFKHTKFRDVDLRGAKNIPFIPLACPSEGSFIGWKKISKSNGEEFLVKLLIPEDAKRSSATSNKCRCDKALVLEITNIDNENNIDVITNTCYHPCVYQVGEYVYPDYFDEDRWKECSHGIHFFIDKQEAMSY